MFIPQSIFIVFIIGSTIISKKYYDWIYLIKIINVKYVNGRHFQ
jgi:hypothetical protein